MPEPLIAIMSAIIFAARPEYTQTYDQDAVRRQAVENAIALYQIVKEDAPIET
jgi:hypothetical protein